MAFRLYAVPMVVVPFEGRGPKYFIDAQVTPPSWTSKDYGIDPLAIVGADCSPANDTFLVGRPDVFPFQVNLDAGINGPRVAAFNNYFEPFNMPMDWLNASFTERQAARVILGIIAMMQRFYGVGDGSTLFKPGVTMGTKLGELVAIDKNNLLAAAGSMNLNLNQQNDNTLLRKFFKDMSDQLQGISHNFNGTFV